MPLRYNKTLRELHRLADSSHQYSVEATVIAVLSDLKQVRVKTADGHQYAITEKTPGIDWTILREGQHVECLVTIGPLPQVVRAKSMQERN